MVKTLYLFDIEGTLIDPKNGFGYLNIDEGLIKHLKLLKKSGYTLGIVSSSYYESIRNKLGPYINLFKYIFPENGLIAYIDNNFLHEMDIKEHVSKEILNSLEDFCNKYISDLNLPTKASSFINYRTALINISPCGRAVSFEQRQEFVKYDKQHHIIQNLHRELSDKFEKDGLRFAIGGEISVECYPEGWDKTYCLQFLTEYDKIHYFGDKSFEVTPFTNLGSRVTGHAVNGIDDTKNKIKELLSEE